MLIVAQILLEPDCVKVPIVSALLPSESHKDNVKVVLGDVLRSYGPASAENVSEVHVDALIDDVLYRYPESPVHVCEPRTSVRVLSSLTLIRARSAYGPMLMTPASTSPLVVHPEEL